MFHGSKEVIVNIPKDLDLHNRVSITYQKPWKIAKAILRGIMLL